MRCTPTDPDRAVSQVARFQNALRVNCADDNVDRVLLEALELPKVRNRGQLSINIKGIEPLTLSPVRHIRMKTFTGLDERREHFKHAALGGCFYLLHNGGDALLLNG